MIDNFSILLSHALLLIMMWRLLSRPDLDREAPAAELREAARAERGGDDEGETDDGWRPRRGTFAHGKGWQRRDGGGDARRDA